MKKLYWANFVLITLNSFITAVVKLLRMDFEMELFRKGGLSDTATIGLGAFQLLGAVLLSIPKTRRYGGIIMAVTYTIGTGVVFTAGMIPFAIFSILFIVMALWPAIRPDAPK